jgi:adenosylcobyric acid synthase
MGFATRAGVPVVLVGDIDRGGVIASLVGTHTILDETDRAQISGYLVNKFRGDVSLFDGGIKDIASYTDWPCFGVVPWLKAASRLPAEDSVVSERLTARGEGALKIAVPMLPRIANFDDLDPLMAEKQVELVFVKPGERLPADAALVIIPGSKATIADLKAMRACGWANDLQGHVRRGGRVIGICGGYQMLGQRICDPDGIEGSDREIDGLGLLDIETVMEPEKTVRNSKAQSLEYDVPLSGYEIHLGRTQGADCARPAVVIDGRPDGAISPDGRVMGSYLHGIFTSDSYRAALLNSFGIEGDVQNYRKSVDDALDDVAAELEAALDKGWLDQLMD